MDEITVEFAGATMVLPAGWVDITDDLPEGSPPTLAKNQGQGALQFSLAEYKAGKEPEFQIATVEDLLVRFFRTNGLGIPENIKRQQGRLFGVSGDSNRNSEHTKIW